jgi:hypothetical protein
VTHQIVTREFPTVDHPMEAEGAERKPAFSGAAACEYHEARGGRRLLVEPVRSFRDIPLVSERGVPSPGQMQMFADAPRREAFRVAATHYPEWTDYEGLSGSFRRACWKADLETWRQQKHAR